MGKGDKKTKRGKIIMGSYGVRRLRKKEIVNASAAKTVAKGLKEKKEKPVVEAKETKVSHEKTVKEPKAAATREKKEEKVATREARPRKEKKQ